MEYVFIFVWGFVSGIIFVMIWQTIALPLLVEAIERRMK